MVVKMNRKREIYEQQIKNTKDWITSNENELDQEKKYVEDLLEKKKNPKSHKALFYIYLVFFLYSVGVLSGTFIGEKKLALGYVLQGVGAILLFILVYNLAGFQE